MQEHGDVVPQVTDAVGGNDVDEAAQGPREGRAAGPVADEEAGEALQAACRAPQRQAPVMSAVHSTMRSPGWNRSPRTVLGGPGPVPAGWPACG